MPVLLHAVVVMGCFRLMWTASSASNVWRVCLVIGCTSSWSPLLFIIRSPSFPFTNLELSWVLHTSFIVLFLTLSSLVFPAIVLRVFISAVRRVYLAPFVSTLVSGACLTCSCFYRCSLLSNLCILLLILYWRPLVYKAHEGWPWDLHHFFD